MPKLPTAALKDTGLSIALKPEERTLIDEAATIRALPISVWARSVILKKAAKIIAQDERTK